MPDPTIPPVAPSTGMITDLSALTSPAPSITTALAGAAAAAPPAAPAAPMWEGRPLPTLTSDFKVARSYDPNAYDVANNPTASPFSEMNANQHAGLEFQKQYEPLTTMGGPVDKMLSFFKARVPGEPGVYARENAASVYGDDRARALLASDPAWMNAAKAKPVEFAQVLKQMMDHADGAPATTTPGGKAIADPEGVNMKAKISGASHDAAHASHEPGQYTESEFIKHIGSLSWNQAAKLWQMQHYLPPQQQMMVGVMNQMAKTRQAALDNYNALMAQGKAANPAALAKAKELYTHHDKMYWDTAGRYTSPQTYAMPAMNNFGGGLE